MGTPPPRTARADVPGFRQETQFTCMAASLAACLKAHGKAQTEADVNLVMGAGAMRGATWEDLTAAAQYFGLRSTLVVPSTVNQLREWTDRGTPVVIAYNPEGRPWSHASVVFDVTGEGSDTMVHIMDPNIPDPDETVRVMPKADFYKVWGEPLGEKMIVRRPACAVEREVTPEGRQVLASTKTATLSPKRVAEQALRRVVAEGADTRSDARGSGYGSARGYMDAVNEHSRSQADAGRRGTSEYFYRWSEWMTSMVLGYAVEADDPAVTWFATKWAKRKNKKYTKILEDALAREKAVSPEHRRKLLALLQELSGGFSNFNSDWFVYYSYDDHGTKHEPRWLESYRQKAKRFKPMKARSVAPKTVVDSATAEKVSILDRLSEAASDNASLVALLDQVKGAYQKGKPPSEADLKAIRHGLYRNRMRAEANHFRQAFEKRVADSPTLTPPQAAVAGRSPKKRETRPPPVREKKDKSKIKVKVQRGGNPHAENALSRKPTRGHARKERGYNKARNPRKYTKHKNLEAGAEIIMDTFMLEAARRVALRFAVDKTAVTSLKLIADAFRPFKHLIAEDPRTWGQWLKRAEREFRKAVDDAPLNDEDHFNFNVFSHSMGVEETSGRLEDPGGRHAPPDYGTATVKYPDSFTITGGSSLHIGYEVYKLAKYADDSRGFVDAYRRVTPRQLKPLLKFLEYVIRGESKLYLAELAVDEAEEEIRKILMAEQESDDGIEVLDFEVDYDSAEVQSLDFDWEAGGDSSITWEWEVVVGVGSVSVSDFDHDDDYGESDYKYDLRREEGW